jgi:transcriptional regulator with XRE-family HTH domain
MEVGEIFAERVRRRLKELDWTHAKLAERLGLAGPTVSQTLNDGRAPRIDTLLRWADALGVEVSWLLGRELVATPTPPSREQMALAILSALLPAGAKRGLIGIVLEHSDAFAESILGIAEKSLAAGDDEAKLSRNCGSD